MGVRVSALAWLLIFFASQSEAAVQVPASPPHVVEAARSMLSAESGLNTAPHTPASTVLAQAVPQRSTALQTVAIIVAVTVFLIREILEARRRRQSRARKLAAIKTVIARGCELNNWTIKSLRYALNAIKDARSGHEPSAISAVFFRNGRVAYKISLSERDYSSGGLPPPHVDSLQSNLLDVAELDATLAGLLDDALSGTAEVEHIRDSLIGYLTEEDDEVHFDGFLDYGLGELDDAFQALDALYRACTGEELSQHRLR